MRLNIDIGGGFAAALTLIFITLKLCGVITWSWLWILSPLWISLLLSLLIFIIIIGALTLLL